jgi:FAD/FMN-containing dehydrogenase
MRALHMSTSMNAAILDQIKQVVGPAGFLEGSDAAPFEIDIRNKYSGRSVLVVRPAATAEVASVVRLCAENGIAIVPQGGNTGLSGGAVPAGERPSIILSCARMNRIVSLDAMRYTVTAQAGCVLDTVHEAAAAADRAFALDWGARGSATIGGAISTNAGGINVLRYGNTREQVLGVEIVLPDGRIWNGLRALRKDSSGYDLKQLFIGAEGTLGIVTQAVMRLHARPAFEKSMLAAVTDFDRLADLFAIARTLGEFELSAFELISGALAERVFSCHPTLKRPLAEPSDWYVLVRLSGSETISSKLESIYERGIAGGLLGDAVVAQSMTQEQQLWMLREEMVPFRYMKGTMLKWDVSVPIDAVAQFVRRATLLAEAVDPFCRLIAFGHVGDGNLHTSAWMQGSASDVSFERRRKAIVDGIDALVWEFGGSICAEHGVGVENVQRLRGQKPEIEMELMDTLKRTLDPQGVFNPGKILRDRSAA